MPTKLIFWALVLLLQPLVGCGDLTFENPGNIDFERFESVYVAPIQVEANAGVDVVRTDDIYRYLTSQLEADGGFKNVSSSFDADSDGDLFVTLDIDAEYDFDTDVTKYSVVAGFALYGPDGAEITSGDETDLGTDLDSVIEETLDKIIHFFLRPYRI